MRHLLHWTKVRRPLLTLSAALALTTPAAAQDIPSEVLMTPAGLAWITAEAQLLGAYAGPRPPDLEARLSALRLQMITQCQDELKRSGTCPESLTLNLLRPLVSSLNEGHTRVIEDDKAALYGLRLVDVQEGPRLTVRVSDARGAFPRVGTVLLRGDEVLRVNGTTVKDARSAFNAASGPVTLTVRRDGRVTDVTVQPRPPAAPMSSPTLRWEQDLPVVTYPSFFGGVKEYGRLIGDLTSQGAPGLVIDLRENRGGQLEHCMLAASLIAGEVEVVMRGPGVPDDRLKAARGELRVPFLTGGGWNTVRVLPDLTFTGHVAVLVNARSASCAEMFTTLARQAGKRVRVYGERTRGAGNSGVSTLPQMGVRVASTLVYTPAGQLFPAFVTPDVPLTDDLVTLGRTGVDTLLDRALADLKVANATGQWPEAGERKRP